MKPDEGGRVPVAWTGAMRRYEARGLFLPITMGCGVEGSSRVELHLTDPIGHESITPARLGPTQPKRRHERTEAQMIDAICR